MNQTLGRVMPCIYTKVNITCIEKFVDFLIWSFTFKVLQSKKKCALSRLARQCMLEKQRMSFLCSIFSLEQAEELLSGITAHILGSDWHVVPVSWPLRSTVAAQILVDASHLVSGHIIRHLQVWVVAVRLGTTHVHCLKHVLAVH